MWLSLSLYFVSSTLLISLYVCFERLLTFALNLNRSLVLDHLLKKPSMAVATGKITVSEQREVVCLSSSKLQMEATPDALRSANSS